MMRKAYLNFLRTLDAKFSKSLSSIDGVVSAMEACHMQKWVQGKVWPRSHSIPILPQK